MKTPEMQPKMGRTRLTLVVGVVIMVVCAIAALRMRQGDGKPRPAAKAAESVLPQHRGAPPEAATLASSDLDLLQKPEAPKVAASPTQAVVLNPTAGVNTQAVVMAKKPSRKKVIQDPNAREALSLVGVDSDAEKYWFEALNDPSLPKNERQDLVDDLNEEGLSDPKHPDARGFAAANSANSDDRSAGGLGRRGS